MSLFNYNYNGECGGWYRDEAGRLSNLFDECMSKVGWGGGTGGDEAQSA